MDRSVKGPSYRPISASRNLAGTKSGNLPRTKSYRQNSGSRSLARLRPRHISMDKEQLYEETLSLKMEVNFFKEQNIRLKTKLQQTEKELGKKEEFLDEIHMNTKEPMNVSNSHLVGSLKHSIKELKAELKLREGDIERLKRDTKVSRVNELEVEIQAYADECTRLRHHIEEVMVQLHQRSSNLKDLSRAEEVLRTLTTQKTTLEARLLDAQDALRKASEQNAALEAKLKTVNVNEVHSLKAEVRKLKHQLDQQEDSNRRVKTLEGESQDLRRELQAKAGKLEAAEAAKSALEAEITVLRAKLAASQKPALPGPIIDDSKYEISVKEEAKAETSYEEEKAIIEEIEKSTRNSTRAFASKCLQGILQASARCKHTLKAVLSESTPDLEELLAALQAVGVATSVEEVKMHISRLAECLLPQFPEESAAREAESEVEEAESSSKQSNYSSNYEEEEKDTSPHKGKGIQGKSLHLSQVFHSPKSTSLAHTDPSLKLLSYRFQLHRIAKNKLGEVLFGVDLDAPVSAESLKSLLLSPPLSLHDEAECEEVVTMVLEKCPDTVTGRDIARVLQGVLEDWEVLSDEEEARFDQHISQLLTKRKEDFLDLCSSKDITQTGEITLTALQEVFAQLRFDFSAKELHYMELLFFSLNFQLNLAPYVKLVEAYAADDSQLESDRSEITMSDEERRAVVKKYLDKIATQLVAKSLDLSQVFRSKEGFLYPDKFIQGLKTLGIPDMKKEELVVFLDALQCEDLDEYGIDMQLFADILDGYHSQSRPAPNDKSLVELGASSDSGDSHSV